MKKTFVYVQLNRRSQRVIYLKCIMFKDKTLNENVIFKVKKKITGTE